MRKLGITDSQNYKDIADAIRKANGTEMTYLPSELAEAILDLIEEEDPEEG